MNVINLGDLGSGDKTKESNRVNVREPAVTGGAAMSEKEKLIYKVMEEMECSREDAVEIVGGEEEEEDEFEVVQVVLIPTISDKKTSFATIFDDTTIEPLELKLRLIMEGQLNTARLVAERGKVNTGGSTSPGRSVAVRPTTAKGSCAGQA